jgi:hypothetical protein
MLSYRITKYDPVFRNPKGAYQKDEWTDFSDIGKVFEGVELLADEYIRIESLYISAIHSFMNAVHVSSLDVFHLEKERYSLRDHDLKHMDLYPNEMTAIVEPIQNGHTLNGNDLESFCRLCLRSQLWGVLEFPSKMFIHFGYEYYMYIGVAEISEQVIEQVRNTGLFVESFESPYLASLNSQD